MAQLQITDPCIHPSIFENSGYVTSGTTAWLNIFRHFPWYSQRTGIACSTLETCSVAVWPLILFQPIHSLVHPENNTSKTATFILIICSTSWKHGNAPWHDRHSISDLHSDNKHLALPGTLTFRELRDSIQVEVQSRLEKPSQHPRQ